ncbi:MAG: MFS transporter [Candidatus Bathyarchaeota archaeon]|nr:MFS transporter [Candidatus Bathyarchaeota archaeon]
MTEDAGNRSSPFRWVILGIAWLTYLSVYMVRISVPPLSPFILDELHLSNTEIGLLVSAAALGYSLFQVPASWLIDRVGIKRMLFAGTFAAGAVIVAMYFVQNLQDAAIILFLGGLGCGCFPAVATKAILQWFPVNERGTVIGLHQTSITVAGIITAILLPLLAVSFGWRFGFLAVGGISMAAAVIASIFYKDAPDTLAIKNPKESGPTNWKLIREVLLDRNILLVSVSCIGFMAVDYSLTTYLIIFLKDSVGLTVTVAGVFLALTNVGGVFGKLFFGTLSDRVLGGSRRKPLLVAGGITLVMTIVMQVIAPGASYWVIALAFAVFGFAAIGWGGLNLILVSEFSRKEYMGLAMGYSLMILMIGNIVGPPVFGYIIDSTGSYSLAWWFLTGCAIASLFFMALVSEKDRRIDA